MNIIIGILVLYIILENGNKFIENYMTDKIHRDVDDYFKTKGFILDEETALIIDSLTEDLISELIPHGKKEFLIIRRTMQNIKTYQNLDAEISKHLLYLQANYGEMFKPKDTLKKDQKYFISYPEDKQLVTLWFTYQEGVVTIVDGTPSFNLLSEKEQYQKLFQLLSELLINRQSYNHSLALDKIYDNDFITNVAIQEEKFLRALSK